MSGAKCSLAALLLVAVAGCATPTTTLEGDGARAELFRSSRGVSLRIDGGDAVALNGLADARLVGVMTAGTERVAVVSGSSEGCAQAHVLVIAPQAGEPRALRLPDCDAEFTFSASGGQLLATHSGARGVRRSWRYAEGALTGPLTSSAAIARRIARPRTDGAAPEPGAVQADAAVPAAPSSPGAQAPTPAFLAAPAPAAEPVLQVAPAAPAVPAAPPSQGGFVALAAPIPTAYAPAPAEAPPPERLPSPIAPVRVSRSVGNDVIPPEVRVGRTPAAAEVNLR
jgi:hypothetical protein